MSPSGASVDSSLGHLPIPEGVWSAASERKALVLVHGQVRCVAGSDAGLCVDRGLFPTVRLHAAAKATTLWSIGTEDGAAAAVTTPLQSPLLGSGPSKAFGEWAGTGRGHRHAGTPLPHPRAVDPPDVVGGHCSFRHHCPLPVHRLSWCCNAPADRWRRAQLHDPRTTARAQRPHGASIRRWQQHPQRWARRPIRQRVWCILHWWTGRGSIPVLGNAASDPWPCTAAPRHTGRRWWWRWWGWWSVGQRQWAQPCASPLRLQPVLGRERGQRSHGTARQLRVLWGALR